MTNNTPQIRLIDGKPVTTSRAIAELFNKRHDNVVQKINSLDCSEQFLTTNFSGVQYTHRGNEYTEFQLTKDGFVFLAMGFTGKKAAQFKEAYITAFNEMETQLRNPSNRIDSIRGLTKADKENLTQAVTVFVDALASQRPIFEIRAVINYMGKAASQFSFDGAVDNMLPFKMKHLLAVINDNKVATIDNDDGDFRVHTLSSADFKYIKYRIEKYDKQLGPLQYQLD